tara:strand:- start:1390 stop:1635 length:246 start_codon:yes stop_codon:yes gene_type:complete
MIGSGEGAWRPPIITIISNNMDKSDVDLIISRINNCKNKKNKGGQFKRKRYLSDDYGLFYWSDRYDKNYTHLWDNHVLASP